MFALLLGLALLGQEAEYLSEATVSPRFGDGRHQGCAIDFDSARRDSLYFEGRAVGADGSFNLYHFGEGRVSAMLKIGIVDQQTIIPPDTAYLVTGFDTNAVDVVRNERGEDQRYQLTMFRFGDATAEAIGAVIEGGSLTVGVQVRGGGGAVPFRVDLTDEQRAQWADCVVALLEDAAEGTEPN